MQVTFIDIDGGEREERHCRGVAIADTSWLGRLIVSDRRIWHYLELVTGCGWYLVVSLEKSGEYASR